jgi:hypothetical protein
VTSTLVYYPKVVSYTKEAIRYMPHLERLQSFFKRKLEEKFFVSEKKKNVGVLVE